MIHHFSESITGVMTIRCFRKQERFSQENINRVNANVRMDFHNNGANEWLGFRLELIGSFVLCISALFMIILPSNIIKPGVNMGICIRGITYGISIVENNIFPMIKFSCQNFERFKIRAFIFLITGCMTKKLMMSQFYIFGFTFSHMLLY